MVSSDRGFSSNNEKTFSPLKKFMIAINKCVPPSKLDVDHFLDRALNQLKPFTYFTKNRFSMLSQNSIL
jgi:hypothetical protein